MNNHSHRPYPVNEELFARIEYVMAFVLQHFLKIDDYIPIWKKSREEEIANKIAHEFALFVFLVSRIPNKPAHIDHLLSRSLDAIAHFIRTDTNYAGILTNPQQLTRFGQVHLLLTKAGNPNDQWDALVMRMFEKGYGANSERIVTRLFDKNWQHYIMFNEHLFDMDDMIKYSIINTRCHPAYMSSNEMYTYTHTLMYMADFGKNEIVNKVNNHCLKDTIQSSLLLQLSDQNYDLSGEFLMNYSYTENSWDAVSYLSWKQLTATWDNIGFLPGVAFDAEIYAGLNAAGKSAYAFKEVYHTNLVAGILCTNLLEAKKREKQTDITSLPACSLSAATLNRVIESAQSFYSIDPEIQIKKNIIPEILCDQIRHLTESKTIPGWLSSLLQSEFTTMEKHSLLVQIKMLLSIKKQQVELLVESIHQYLSLNLPSTSTFTEAVECICNRQLLSGEFLIPGADVSSAWHMLSRVHKELENRKVVLN